MERILKARKGEKLLLIGNEAIVRGAIEAGIKVATTYPGTPASEIGDTFFRIASRINIHFEYSINEKVAFEVAYGASLGGARALSSMKHLGLNVAGDPFVTSAYVGAVGGFVIVSAGEPGSHTSPNEQDHRYFGRMANVPVFDPCDPQEALDMTRAAFELSEKWKLPVLLRPTTRVSHTQGVVRVGKISRQSGDYEFIRDQQRFVPVPRTARILRRWLIERIGKVVADKDCRRFNRLEGRGRDLAIVTSGVSYCYVLDAVRAIKLKSRVRILKLGIPYPLSEDFVAGALRGVSRVLVVEEFEPFLEDFIKKSMFETGMKAPVFGKTDGSIPLAGELTPRIVREAVERAVTKKRLRKKAQRARIKNHGPIENLPVRPPILCPGCPHRASFFALRLVAGPDDIFTNDIGCYTLGMDPPFNMGDILLCMGASITQGGGLSRTTKRKIVAFIGDSTFFHSGITGLANAVINKHDLLVVILDNRVTAMTGHQPSPSDLETSRGDDKVESLSLEAMVAACGVKNIVVVDPADINETNKQIKKLYDAGGVSVVISRHPCPLFFGKGKKDLPTEKKTYRVDSELCRVCSQSCGEAACKLEPTADYSFIRTLKSVAPAPSFQRIKEKTPCSYACPAGVCIQGFIGQAQSGNLAAAYGIIRRSLPLASVLARVCPRPCENLCVRGEHDAAVAVNDIKRFVLDSVTRREKDAFIRSLLKGVKFHGRKVAVIGSGPAGLSAAWELRLRGYDVTVFEKEKQPGGLLRFGIPRFRLPEDVLKEDIDEIVSSIGTLKTGVQMGRDFSLDDLFKQGFGAVFIGAGAAVGMIPDMEGRGVEGVTQAIEFMRSVESGKIKNLSGKVVVVGGGDAAMDTARTAVRLGARETTVLYRRTRKEMPACGAEIDDAQREGVRFVYQALPVKIFSEKGKGISIDVIKTKLGDLDSSGRRKPVPVSGSEFNIRADKVIFATSQSLGDDVKRLFKPSQLTGASFLKVDPVTMMTERRAVFAGGDVVSGPATVVNALAAGTRAAWGIDVFLRKDKALPLDPGLEKYSGEVVRPKLDFINIEKKARINPRTLTVDQRKGSFKEVNQSPGTDEIMQEASRCFSCSTCALCSACVSVLGCSAFFVDENGKMQINENLCNGCGLCVYVCPNHAISEVEARPQPAAVSPGKRKTLEVIKSPSYDSGQLKPVKPLRIHFAGVGGQGTLGASGILGEAAKGAGLNVIIGALHGMAQRGGMVTNQVIIGEARSPIIDAGEADIIAGFEPIETLRSFHFGREGCIIFMNRSQVVPFTMTMAGSRYPDADFFIETMKKKALIIFSLDATALAAKAGNPKAIGPVMLGFMAGTGVFPFKAAGLRKTLAALSPAKRVEVNLKAFDQGAAAAAFE